MFPDSPNLKVFFVAFLTKFLCPDTMYTVEEAEKFLRPKGYIIVHGEIFNRLGYTKTKNPVDFSTMESMDASEYFPFTTASGALVTECNPTGLVFGEVAKCHGRNDCLETKEFFKLANDQKNGVRVESGLVVKYFGPVARKTVQILEQTKNNNKWIRFGQRVYNVTELIQNKLMYPQWDIAGMDKHSEIRSFCGLSSSSSS